MSRSACGGCVQGLREEGVSNLFRPLVKGKVALLDEFARLRNEGDFEACAKLFAEDITWSTVYNEEVKGREGVREWMESEKQAGRRNVDAGTWIRAKGKATTYQREIKVMFPSKATHDVVQTIKVGKGEIQHVDVKPKFQALRVALEFAKARLVHDHDAALALMSDDVEWKAWDGFHVEGKDGVRKLFHEQKGREVSRVGQTEFEAATVNEQGGVFERLLDIERVDGIKVRTTQRLFVKGMLTQLAPLKLGDGTEKPIWGVVPKIIEVHVLTTEELIDGKWKKSTEDDHW